MKSGFDELGVVLAFAGICAIMAIGISSARSQDTGFHPFQAVEQVSSAPSLFSVVRVNALPQID